MFAKDGSGGEPRGALQGHPNLTQMVHLAQNGDLGICLMARAGSFA